MVSEWTISGSLIIAYLVYAFLNGIKGSKEPPGPRRIPIIGNLLPPVKPWFQMAKWTKEFGGVYSLRILSTPAVVIGNVEAAHELLEAKSIYWGRKPPKMVEL